MALAGYPLTAFQSEDAFVVNPDYLISDAEMVDVYSMSLLDIERFLLRGALAQYRVSDVSGVERSAAEIIFRAAQEFDLSPRFLLVLLQREQSLVEDASPTQDQLDWAMGYAICDDCSKSDPAIQKYKGFANQVYYAAKRIRESYIADLESRGFTETGMGPGIETTIDGVRVVPVNNATASLYTYTPHLEGNENFASIWDRWFSFIHPSGTLLQDKESGGIWLIQYGLRRPITSRAAFSSRFNPQSVIQVSATSLEKYPIGSPVHFPNYSLLRSPGGTVYLIVDDTRRGFVSQEAFKVLGFSTDEIVDVTWEDLEPYRESEPLTIASNDPEGLLLQDKTTGGVYYVTEGKKHPIFSREILASRFPEATIQPVAPEDLEVFERSGSVLFQDGVLIGAAGSPDVYVISEGARHPIVDELTFYSFGWDWDQIIWTTPRAVFEHPLGEPLILETREEVSIATR